MKPVLNPRFFTILILAPVIVILFAGTLITFGAAGAAAALDPTATLTGQAIVNVTPSATAVPVRPSADTTGIIALAIVIGIVVLIGSILGQKERRKRLLNK